MQISVRSYLTAGTAAVVGAGAIALTPVLPAAVSPAALPAPVVAEVALSGLSLSLTDVIGLLDGLGIGGVVPDFLTALPSLLPTDIVTAVVTEFVNQASPLVLVAAGEVFDYLSAAVAGLISGPDSIPARFGDALAAIPATLVSAVGFLGTGDLATAVQTATEGLSGPAAGITAVLTEAGAAFQDFLTTEFTGLVTALPGVLWSAVQTVITNNVQSLIDSISGALSGLLGGLVPGAGASVVAAAATAEDTGTIVCNMPAIRSTTVQPAAAVAIPASVTSAAAVAVSVERARVSAPRARAEQPKPAAAVAQAQTAQVDQTQAVQAQAAQTEAAQAAEVPAAAVVGARSTAGKADAGRGARVSAR